MADKRDYLSQPFRYDEYALDAFTVLLDSRRGWHSRIALATIEYSKMRVIDQIVLTGQRNDATDVAPITEYRKPRWSRMNEPIDLNDSRYLIPDFGTPDSRLYANFAPGTSRRIAKARSDCISTMHRWRSTRTDRRLTKFGHAIAWLARLDAGRFLLNGSIRNVFVSNSHWIIRSLLRSSAIDDVW